ncbi:MAG: hypothetical protein KDE35_04895 [Geminicoccaceae bacterium]|nr:hypothetical protein [Geminicoccaceae bacterium]
MIAAFGRPHRILAAPILSLVVLAGLGGCAGTDGGAGCPRVAIIHGLDRLETPSGFDVTLALADSGCSFAQGALELDYALNVIARPGLSPRTDTLEARYFVALVDAAGTPMDKTSFGLSLPLDPSRAELVLRETIRQKVDAVTPGQAADMQVLFGFQLPREQALRQHQL